LAQAVSTTKPDVIHCHEPDALVSALLAADGRVPVIYDSHEMWGASAAGRFPPPLWPLAERVFQAGERRLIRRCSAAIGASWAISDFLRQELDGSRVETILNVPVPEVFGPPPARSWGEVTYLCHDGHLSWDRGLRVMVEAARIVARDHRVVLRIVGDVFGEEREWLDGYLAQHGCAGLVERTGWLPYSEVGNALAPCHIGLVALQRIPNNVVTSSNKVFNYMLYGIPFVGPEFRLSKQKLVREERCGVLADSSSPESYARAISAMIEDRAGTEEMGRRAAAASRERYRWEHMEPLLVGLYRRVLGT
jgi:glycosyltransferase involved in cell wall biosynthesis